MNENDIFRRQADRKDAIVALIEEEEAREREKKKKEILLKIEILEKLKTEEL